MRILDVFLLPVYASLPLATSLERVSTLARAQEREDRVHIDASVRALERHDERLSPPAPLTRPRSREDTAIQRAIRRECVYTGCIARVARFLRRFHGGYGTDFSSAKLR